jgi:hypothetical protein
MRAAQINPSGVVINFAEVIAFDGVQFIDPTGAAMGATWNGSIFLAPTPPPTPVPQCVTAFQAKAALLNTGLYTSVSAYMTSSATPIDQLAWTEAASFQRTDTIISNLMESLGLTNAQLDALFIAAAQISP